jgi:hypothetical protein
MHSFKFTVRIVGPLVGDAHDVQLIPHHAAPDAHLG